MQAKKVASYAPEGYTFLRTEYADGATRHVFGTPEGGELVCAAKDATADAELEALEAFRARYAGYVPADDPRTHKAAFTEALDSAPSTLGGGRIGGDVEPASKPPWGWASRRDPSEPLPLPEPWPPAKAPRGKRS